MSAAPRYSSYEDGGGPFSHPGYVDGVLGRRLAAYAVDVVVIAVLMTIAWLGFAVLTLASLGLLSPILWTIWIFIPFLYHTALIGGSGSATVGMYLFDLEVRTWTGGRPGYLQAALQTLIFYATVSATGGLILLVALFTPFQRTAHDLVTGTIIVRRHPPPIETMR